MREYLVRLEAQERGQLVRVGKAATYRIRHANILSAVDESKVGPKLSTAGCCGVGDALRPEGVGKDFVVAP